MLFIENDEASEEQEDGITKRPAAVSTTNRRKSIVADKPESELIDIERKIKEVEGIVSMCEIEMDPLSNIRKKIEKN